MVKFTQNCVTVQIFIYQTVSQQRTTNKHVYTIKCTFRVIEMLLLISKNE